jgi:hypothetical protein
MRVADDMSRPSFTSHSIPYPIVVADTVSRSENVSNIITAEGEIVPLSNPIYEFSVCESGPCSGIPWSTDLTLWQTRWDPTTPCFRLSLPRNIWAPQIRHPA